MNQITSDHNKLILQNKNNKKAMAEQKQDTYLESSFPLCEMKLNEKSNFYRKKCLDELKSKGNYEYYELMDTIHDYEEKSLKEAEGLVRDAVDAHNRILYMFMYNQDEPNVVPEAEIIAQKLKTLELDMHLKNVQCRNMDEHFSTINESKQFFEKVISTYITELDNIENMTNADASPQKQQTSPDSQLEPLDVLNEYSVSVKNDWRIKSLEPIPPLTLHDTFSNCLDHDLESDMPLVTPESFIEILYNLETKTVADAEMLREYEYELENNNFAYEKTKKFYDCKQLKLKDLLHEESKKVTNIESYIMKTDLLINQLELNLKIDKFTNIFNFGSKVLHKIDEYTVNTILNLFTEYIESIYSKPIISQTSVSIRKEDLTRVLREIESRLDVMFLELQREPQDMIKKALKVLKFDKIAENARAEKIRQAEKHKMMELKILAKAHRLPVYGRQFRPIMFRSQPLKKTKTTDDKKLKRQNSGHYFDI